MTWPIRNYVKFLVRFRVWVRVRVLVKVRVRVRVTHLRTPKNTPKNCFYCVLVGFLLFLLCFSGFLEFVQSVQYH